MAVLKDGKTQKKKAVNKKHFSRGKIAGKNVLRNT